MDTRLFSSDPESGITRWFHYDPTNELCTIETVQDMTQIVEWNKAEHANVDERTRWGNGLERVASIPLAIYHDLIKKKVISEDGQTVDQKGIRKFLNDPDNRFFRTRPGRV